MQWCATRNINAHAVGEWRVTQVNSDPRNMALLQYSVLYCNSMSQSSNCWLCKRSLHTATQLVLLTCSLLKWLIALCTYSMIQCSATSFTIYMTCIDRTVYTKLQTGPLSKYSSERTIIARLLHCRSGTLLGGAHPRWYLLASLLRAL